MPIVRNLYRMKLITLERVISNRITEREPILVQKQYGSVAVTVMCLGNMSQIHASYVTKTLEQMITRYKV